MDNLPNTVNASPKNYQQTHSPGLSNKPPKEEPNLTIIPNGQVLRGKMLGAGGFGKIYSGSWKTFQIAIKILKERKLNDDLKQEFFNESTIMAGLQHSHIVRFYGICKYPYAMVMELLPMGDLSNLLSNRKQQLPWEPKRWQWALDIGSGLAYLHSKKVLHRDLKSQNILLDENLRAKITDFGLSRIKAQSKLYTKNQAGSLPWMAPELFARRVKLTPASDVYAYGVTLWEIAARKIPFVSSLQGRDINIIPVWVKDGERPDIPKECPKAFAHIITMCWEQDPEKRPTAIEALKALHKVKPSTVPDVDSEASPFKVIEILRVLTTFIGRKDHLATLEKGLIKKGSLYVLAGLGGVGKSELACQFANQFISRFDLIYWIPSETQLQRETAFRDLAAKLGIHVDKEDHYAVIQKKVYSALEKRSFKQPYLLIFDNLTEKEIFPKNGSILVTTQKGDLYQPEPTLTVKPFTENEAMQLVQVMTKDTNLASIKKLVSALGNFPLAIDKACAYISKEGQTVSKYIEHLDVQELLKEAGTKRHERSLLATWKLTVKKLDPLAVEWLNLCAYLAPDNIPSEWIVTWLEQQKQKENKADMILGNLRSYGLIDYARQGGPVSIHRLLQQILLMYRSKVYEQKTLRLLLDVVRSFDPELTETWSTGKSFLFHAKKYISHPFFKFVDQKLSADLLNNMGDVELHFQHHTVALFYYQTTLEMRKRIHKNDHPDVAQSLHNIGRALTALMRYTEALTPLLEALEIRKKLYGDENVLTVRTLKQVGVVFMGLERYEKALACFQQALSIQKRLKNSRGSDIAWSLNDIAGVFYYKNEVNKALNYAMQALEIQKQVYGNEHPSVAQALHNIGLTLSSNGQDKIALKYLTTALTIRKKIYGDEHPMIGDSLNAIGGVYASLENNSKALFYHQQSLTIYQKVYNSNHPLLGEILCHIAELLEKKDENDEAISYYQQALTIYRSASEDHKIQIAAALQSIGVILIEQNKTDKAIAYLQEALVICKNIRGNADPAVAALLYYLGIALHQQNKSEQALSTLKKALAIQSAQLGKEHHDVALTSSSIADILIEKGAPREALTYLVKALKIRSKIFGQNSPEIIDKLVKVLISLQKYKEAIYYIKILFEIAAIACEKEDINIDSSFNALIRMLDDPEILSPFMQFFPKILEMLELVSAPDELDLESLCSQINDWMRQQNVINEQYQLFQQNSHKHDLEQPLLKPKKIKAKSSCCAIL